VIRRRIPRELRPERRPGGLRRALRLLAIGLGLVLVATAAVPAVGVLIAVAYWLLLASVLAVAGAVAAGPVRRHAPAAAAWLVAALVAAGRWVGAHCPPWLLAALARTVGLLARAARVGGRLLGRRRPRVLVAAIAAPRVPVAALPPAPADTGRNRDRDEAPWGWTA